MYGTHRGKIKASHGSNKIITNWISGPWCLLSSQHRTSCPCPHLWTLPLIFSSGGGLPFSPWPLHMSRNLFQNSESMVIFALVDMLEAITLHWSKCLDAPLSLTKPQTGFFLNTGPWPHIVIFFLFLSFFLVWWEQLRSTLLANFKYTTQYY